MPQVNLTSIEHAASLLADRTLTDAVADDLSRHLRTATNLIAAHLKTSFTADAQVKVYDINPGFSDTPGAFATPFTQKYRPSFDLPITGSLSALSVKYRGSTPLDEDFDWDDIEPLVQDVEYLYDEATGRIKLLFAPTGMIHGLRVAYTEGYSTTPDKLWGSKRTDHMTQLGIETTLSPIQNLFTGADRKQVSDAATVNATQPDLVSLIVQPPVAAALHSLRVFSPNDRGMPETDQSLTLTLKAGASSETTLTTQVIDKPLAGQVYTLAGAPAQTHPRYELTITGTTDSSIAVGKVIWDFADADVVHMKGSAPDPLTEACAILAAHLFYKENSQTTGKSSNRSGQTMKGSANMPAEVIQMLRPYKSQRVRFF